MKNRKAWTIIIISTFLFLVLLLFIQIKWLIDTAKTEKQHFTQSVKLSIDFTMHQIMSDQSLCSNIQRCLLDSQCQRTKELKKLQWDKIDSIIKSNLKVYDINCDYDFDIKIIEQNQDEEKVNNGNLFYSENLKTAYQQGNLQLAIRLPAMNSFIVKRIGPLFISSILLIFLVAASFIITLRIYFKEEKRAILIKNFILNMAHEFKTPVSVIGLANSRIKKNIENSSDNKIMKYVEIIDNEKNKIQEHLTAILDLACFENKNAIIHKEEVKLSEIIETALSNVRCVLEEKNAILVHKISNENLLINGNKSLLINSITNIIDNACKYSNSELKIEISAFESKEMIFIEIADNGIGISKKDIPYIFDKYFRVSTGNIHNIKGHGIGLSYVKEVVKLHDGSVEVESTPGSGSIFRIILPKINHTA